MYPKFLGILLLLPAIYAFRTASAVVKFQSETMISFSFLPMALQRDTFSILIAQNKSEVLAAGNKYKFHIHENPVPENGDCNGTGGHYDPNGVGKDAAHYKCDPRNITTCEKGDLSGKWGALESSKEKRVIIETSMKINDIIGKSVVVHNQDGSKWLCATIVGTD